MDHERCSKCGSTENVVLGNCEPCSLKMIDKIMLTLKVMGIEDEFTVERVYIPELGKSCLYLKADLSRLTDPDKH